MKKTLKQLTIVHRGVAQLHNGESAAVGTARALMNMRERENALEVVGNPQQVAQLQPGDKVLLVDDDRTLLLRDGNVVWNDMVVLSTSATVHDAHKVGILLVVVTSEGNVVMRRTASGYECIDIAAALPQIHLAAVEQQQLSTTIPEFEFNEPYTTWQAPLATADIEALSKLMRNALTTMQRNATSQGRFTGPLLARYAVRLWDDSYLWMSQPVMVGHNIISASYRTTTTATTANNRFIGIEAFDLSANSYRLGISMATGIAAEWRDIVKAIDVLVSPVAVPYDVSTIDYRCATTTSGGTRRYLLEIGPKPRSTTTMLQTILNCDWRVVASTAQLDGTAFTAANTTMTSQQVIPGHRCDVVTAQLLSPRQLSQKQCAAVMANCTLRTVAQVSMEHNGRLYQAPTAYHVTNPWHVLPWLDGTLTAGTVNATVQVTMATNKGMVTLSKTVSCPCGATSLNPFVAFPETRATHIAIAVGNKLWQADLTPLEESDMAVFINPSLQSNTMTTGSIQSSANDNNAIPTKGEIVVSAVGNPLVTQWRATVSGCSILALGAACRPIYSGGFGRYPIYIFTTQGIMALPQSTNGNYGEPRLITETVIASNPKPVAGGDALWFISQHGILCSLTGSTVRRLLSNQENGVQLAWNDCERELWIAAPDGTVQVLMPSGRTYSRDLTVGSLYSDPTHALAVTTDGTLLDLAHENSAIKIFSFLSHPFEIDPMMCRRHTRITWNLFTSAPQLASNDADVTLTLRGERGSSCHGYVISSVKATGVIAAPLSSPVILPPTRSLRLQATGTIPSGTLLLPTSLYLK